MTRPRGPMPDWKPTRVRQKAILADLLERYQQHYDDDTLPRGGRGIFYDLRPFGMGNGITYRKADSLHPVKATGNLPGFNKDTEAHVESVGDVLKLARRAGMIPEEWVADMRLQPPLGGGGWDNAEQLARILATHVDGFELDHQRDQPVYIEVLCEAADLMPRISRVVSDYGVSVYSGGGFDGVKGKRETAERADARDVPTLVLHLGDRDEKGEEIYYAAAEDSVAWAASGKVYEIGADFDEFTDDFEDGDLPTLSFFRLGLTPEQADANHLDLLDSDGKAEADSIPVKVLDGWLTNAVTTVQDQAIRQQVLEDEVLERERVPGLLATELSSRLENDDEDADDD